MQSAKSTRETPALRDSDFARLSALIQREAGIYLAPCKKEVVVARLRRRLRELDLASFASYCDLVEQRADGPELQHLLDSITTQQTQFFREPAQFRFLVERVIPCWREAEQRGERPRRVRVWSAGCATGEEPYTLAIVLLGALAPSQGWRVDILATDISTRALAAARRGIWPIERSRDIPTAALRAYMLRGVGERSSEMAAGPVLRAAIRFRRLNLNDTSYDVEGRFDLILCRNVMIYFDAAARAGVVARLAARLEPGGLFFVGHSETLLGATGELRPVAHAIYQRPR